MMILQARSPASWQASWQLEKCAVVCKNDPLNAVVVINATAAAANWPIPCMENTAAIIAPRHLVGANSEVITIDVSIEARCMLRYEGTEISRRPERHVQELGFSKSSREYTIPADNG